MTATRVLQRSFAGGEVAPAMVGRVDDTRRENGFAEGRNFVCRPQGILVKRGGFAFSAECAGVGSSVHRVIAFQSDADSGILLEFTIAVMRLHSDGAPVLHPVATAWSGATAYIVGDLASRLGVTYYCVQAHTNQQPPNASYWYAQPASGVYEVPHSIPEASLFNMTFAQSGDIMTFCENGMLARELRRYSATRWVWTGITFAATLSAPNPNSSSATFGEYLRVDIVHVNAGISNLATFATERPHRLVNGDVGYLSASLTAATAFGGMAAGYYVVELSSATPTDDYHFTLKELSGGGVDGSTGTASGGFFRLASPSSDVSYVYAVTAVGADDRESLQSSDVTIVNNLSANGAKNTIGWPAISGASRYRVYRKVSGQYAFLAETASTSYVDDGTIEPRGDRTPPQADTTLPADLPAAVAYYETRRVFAGTVARPQGVLATRSGTEADMSFHIPVLDTDRLSFNLAARDFSQIRHLVPGAQLVALTSSGEYRITSQDGGALSPGNITARPQSHVGASTVRPLVVNGTIVFVAARGGHVYEFGFREDAGGYVPGDMSTRAIHLFDDLTIVDSAQQKAPFPTLWFVSSNGLLLGFTYVPEEQVGAWHVHETDGLFKSIACVQEDNEDRLYAVIERTINGGTKRYVERMAAFALPRDTDGDVELEECFYVDAGATYDGSPATSITGLSHLEGETVVALADGIVRGPFTVASGAITLPVAASVVHVGLPYSATLETLPIALNVPGWGQGMQKRVSKTWFRTIDSTTFDAGPVGYLKPARGLSATAVATTQAEVTVPGKWGDGAVLAIEHTDPTPCAIVNMAMQVEAVA